MIPTVLAALALWATQMFLPAGIRYALAETPPADRLMTALGSRDQQPPLGVYGERALRAQRNYAESLVIFLPLALLLEHQGAVDGLALNSAMAFVVLRVLYVPAYIGSWISGLRSTIWTGAACALLAMAYALLT